MKHSIYKVKFRRGKDSNESVMRKLVLNFLKHGKLETTVSKAKAVKSLLDRLAFKARRQSEADKNVLLKHLGDKKAVQDMFDKVEPTFKKRTGGFVTIIRLGTRLGDNAEMARIGWTKPIITLEKKVTQNKPLTPEKEKQKNVKKTKLKKLV